MITEIIGEKVGMTHIFDKDGSVIPVTVINTKPNIVIQKKNMEKDGYNAVQLGFGTVKKGKTNKPLQGQFKAAKTEPLKVLKEVIVANSQEFQIGQEIKNDIFKEGDFVDVRGISKGKGFAGVMKRYNFHGVPATHGVSVMHRRAGSVGCRSFPGKVMKGKKMAGHMGDETVSVLKLKVIRSDVEKGILLIKGAVPGTYGGVVEIKKTVKRIKNKSKK
ncbi:MAG: 50S ribosomal protein L3 [Candidatus Firestonebacteria bacterium]|nr:50S ribosomal protein L3 [Candidatus Firestonebacteria bacterium]